MADYPITHLPRAAFPEEAGLSSRKLQAFLHDLDRMGLNMHTVMVTRGGKVALECAWAPFDLSIPHTMFSFSKQVTSIAVGFCVSEGLLSLSDPVSKYFPYNSGDDKHDALNEGITVYDLITQRSGKNISIFTTNNEKNEWLNNWLSAPFKGKTGESFNYLSENIYMLSRLVTKVSGQSLTEFLTPRLFEPLGIEVPYWEHDHNGFDAGGWGAFLKTEDMAKLGVCFLNMGEYDGKQVIPAEWITQSTTRHLEKVPPTFTDPLGYGFQLFIQPEFRGTYSFNGLYTQFNIMYPKYDAVFTCTAGELREADFLHTVHKHFPGVFTEDYERDEAGEQILCDYVKKMADRRPPMARRRPEIEAQINGREIRTTGRKNASVLGSGNNFMLSARAGKINSIRFHFSEDALQVEFTEKNSPRSVVNVGLDGEYLFSEIKLSELTVPVASYGTWDTENIFKLTVVPQNMAQSREFYFHFLPAGVVHVTSKAVPGFKDLFEFYLQFNGMVMNEPLRKTCTAAAALVSLGLDPNFYGVIK